MALHQTDYGSPRSVEWHNFLNRFGFNFYQSSIPTEEGDLRIKYGVISAANFIKGCNGTLEEKEETGAGKFGLYVAGRMQKVALRSLHDRNDEQNKQLADIEAGINTARIDGVWLAMGLQDKRFTFDQLLTDYVSLSYRADIRPERTDKIPTLIEMGKADYQRMLDPIIQDFRDQNLITQYEDGGFEKMHSLSKEQVERRLKKIKQRTFIIN